MPEEYLFDPSQIFPNGEYVGEAWMDSHLPELEKAIFKVARRVALRGKKVRILIMEARSPWKVTCGGA